MKPENNRPDRILTYFRQEWLPILFTTIFGLLYNGGLLACPWFEGRLAQCLADILGGSDTAAHMVVLVLAYIAVTLLVQAARFVKRFYVRRFANNINRIMKGVLYANLLRQSRSALEHEGAGELMTKAISDVDDCAEGMRKFTTEVFDTGVALVGYVVMLARPTKKQPQRSAPPRSTAHGTPLPIEFMAVRTSARNGMRKRWTTMKRPPCAQTCGSRRCRRCIW